MEELNSTSDAGSGDAIVSSTNTSLSGLTGYEEEFNDLKLLTCTTPTSPQFCRSQLNDTSKFIYETKIKNLTSELDNVLKLNEKLKNDLFSKESKYEEENQKKINSFIAKNAHLEAHLTAIRSCIEGLLKQYISSDLVTFETDDSSNLCAQIKLIQNEIIRYNNEKNNNELLVKNIKSQLEIAKEEIQARVACVNELKKKVSEQYSSIENVLQYNKELESKLKAAESELSWCKKSENWYKDQLHNAQFKNMESSETVIKLQQLILVKDQDIQKLNINVSKWKHDYDALLMFFKKERGSLSSKIERLQFDMIDTTPHSTEESTECHTCNRGENDIEKATNEIDKMKKNIAVQTKHYEGLCKQNSELEARVILLQKTLNEKEIALQNFELEKVDLQNELYAKQILEQNQTKNIINLKELNDTLQVKLAALEREKMEVENVVGFIRQDLNKVMLAHTQLKQDISQKDKMICGLQNKIEQLAKNNSDTEQVKLKAFELEVARKDKLNQELCERNANSELKIVELKSAVSLLENTIADLEKKCELTILNKDKFIASIQNSLLEAEQRNRVLEEVLQEEKLNLIASEKGYTDLSSMLQQREAVLKSLRDERDDLNRENLTLRDQIKDLNKQLSCFKEQCGENSTSTEFCNAVIENTYIESPRLGLKLHAKDEEPIIMEILELISDRLQKVEMNILRKEDINIELKTLSAESKSFLLLQNIMQKLFSLNIKTDFQKPTSQKFQDIALDFSDFVFKKMHFLLDKCNTVDRKIKNCCQNLNSFKQVVPSSNPSEEIIKLKVYVLELKEKLKRYEINNHTLLRKVKEHMKARNSAEKQNSQLQNLYSSLNEAYATINLEFNSKKLEIEQAGLLITNLQARIDNLQQSLFDLEKQLVERKIENDALQSSVREKENLASDLKRCLVEKSAEVENCKNLLINLECQVIQLKDLNVKLSGSRPEFQLTELDKTLLAGMLKSSKYKPSHGDDVKNTKNKMQEELQRLNNDRWFLQRLCNDLKFALQASHNQTQVLKAEKLKQHSGLQDFVKNLPVPSRCNDVLIEKLLEKNQSLCSPFSAAEVPFKSLKLELNNLQKCVEKRKCFSEL